MPEQQELDLAGRNVLVTGASGFIGAHLCRKLQATGAHVHATSRSPQPNSGSSWHRVDLGDADSVDALVDAVRPEVVFHLASYVAGARSLELVPLTFHANLASTVHLLTATTRQGGLRRFIQVGSLEEPEPGEPLAVPSSPYAAAKMSASGYARMFHALYETPVVLARLFMVYGPAQNDLKKLIPYLILSLLEGREPRLSSGTREIDWIFVDDVVEGLIRAATHEDLDGRRIDLGSGRLVTIRGVVEELYRQLAPGSEAPFGSLGDRPMEQVRRARVDETEELLGWWPETSLEDGLRATVDWYRQELEAGRIETGGE